ncbi:similar to Saccharomyces cerevisiae YDR165W TRM82 Subunit of a tRNA methyltransferase complex composed of Trm8p and Trm82p that catalyzes 7-methylguanosine modification of tRNA [Maudiozyma saulgeensis]|uniref:Similar to Saccharomyces cerevisiae YDR165W TRM82 Subunit of a tRNA methyltransferase complex composed of Trm8p and Trm82p that catalyzes 7-methylguanosine modification of tRNA n=1 Tax=Maudiozyma saulgeensis TaxID=1789683 RepID=A0A1X7R5Y9_9SACH|nr:similar to Saccharomyces cerevisiae YDR165W TRM82 Subunit of a tRNA methyltransferase complex composed of Trm8p and Trm82p that catalyzes 7-methylguanosine modification of tRNA [Kazachstania saulgeensis]
MTIIHPVQTVAALDDSSVIFAVIKNVILGYKREDSGSYKLIGKWVDEFDRTESIKNKVTKEQDRQINENAKKQKDNEGNVIVQKKKTEAKIPVPGPGAPPVYSCIRNLLISKDGSKLLSCADSDKSVLVFDIDLNNDTNCLQLVKRQPFPKRPNSITISDDGKTVVMADKFGDVYSIPTDGEPLKDINDELDPILGHVSMLTDVLFKTDSHGKKFIITSDRDEHIKVSHFPQSFIVDKWLFGHSQFVSSICSPQWKSEWLFSAGGDDFVYLWDWELGKKLSEFKYSDMIKPYLTDKHLAPSRFQNESNDIIEYAVSKIISFTDIPYVAFFVEATKILFIAKVDVENKKIYESTTLELPYNIISLDNAYNNEIVLSLDNRDSNGKDFIKFVKYNQQDGSFELNEKRSNELDACINELKSDSDITVEEGNIYPLYSTTTLRKHGEHYS